MDDLFKIYILRLTEGRTEKIKEDFDPSFIDIAEVGLVFDTPVHVAGSASVANQALILRLEIDTVAKMPCAICNKEVPVPIVIKDFCYTVEISEIKGGVFNYSGVLREAILLELPIAAECAGNCPEREALSKFFSSQKEGQDNEYHPFKNL